MLHVNNQQYSLSWAVALVMVYVDHHYYFSEDYYIEWIVYLIIATMIFIIALMTLFTLIRTSELTFATQIKATTRLVLLSVVYYVCYGTFGAVNLTQVIVCAGGRYPISVLRLFCNPETFYSILFILPTVNSIANAVVLFKTSVIRQELSSWLSAS